jgi:hypothetical protein
MPVLQSDRSTASAMLLSGLGARGISAIRWKPQSDERSALKRWLAADYWQSSVDTLFDSVFAPMHWLDRRIRPHVWTS